LPILSILHLGSGSSIVNRRGQLIDVLSRLHLTLYRRLAPYEKH
jgi:hypothetical protein